MQWGTKSCLLKAFITVSLHVSNVCDIKSVEDTWNSFNLCVSCMNVHDYYDCMIFSVSTNN